MGPPDPRASGAPCLDSRRPVYNFALTVPPLLPEPEFMKHAVLIASCLALAGLSAPALAKGDAAKGKALAYTCTGCHGITDYKNAYPSYRVPKIAGQNEAYIVAALDGYRKGERNHPTMKAQASSYTDADIADIAAYLASLKSK